MSASSIYTYEFKPGYDPLKGGNEAFARRVEAAQQRIAQSGETPASSDFGYNEGSPTKNPDGEFSPNTMRMAGDKFIDRGLLAGPFAQKIGENGPLRESMGEYIGMLNNGMFGMGQGVV